MEVLYLHLLPALVRYPVMPLALLISVTTEPTLQHAHSVLHTIPELYLQVPQEHALSYVIPHARPALLLPALFVLTLKP